MLNAIEDFLKQVKSSYAQRNTSEHTYRPHLQTLFQSYLPTPKATVINEPAQIPHLPGSKPDFMLLNEETPIGFVEAKDTRVNLDDITSSAQLQRYRQQMTNLLLTNNIEFRWYHDGQERERVAVATITNGQFQLDKTALPKLDSLLGAFVTETLPAIPTPEYLADFMARQARNIAAFVRENLESATPNSELKKQFKNFQKALLPALTHADFADMYAQTLVYGLFVARLHWNGQGTFNRGTALTELLPKTNPFLGRFFNEIAGFNALSGVTLFVNLLVQLLAKHEAIPAVLQAFSQKEGRQNVIIHFYETFLQHYDPATREQRGVYYTPQPVVDYMVAHVHSLLKGTFKRPLGLADKDTKILDPATGTGTFLHSIITQVQSELEAVKGTWGGYVQSNLLPRLFGFELLIAPYTIAHFNLAALLESTGYQFHEEERLNIFLTNALAAPTQERIDNFIEQEGLAADSIKTNTPLMVIIGNPPYSGHSANTQFRFDPRQHPYFQLDGQGLGERNPQWLQDDYVKFIDFGQKRIEANGEGILAFITNHGYLTNVTFRGMRQHLLRSFDELYILDLHGNARKRELSPDGTPDQNVFNIQQGVAIAFFVKLKQRHPAPRLYHADLWGARSAKFEALAAGTLPWQELQPSAPFYLFTPQNNALWAEYEAGWRITDVFPINSMGFKTHRDHFAIAFERETLRQRLLDMHNPALSDSDLQTRYDLKDNRDWQLSRARSQLRETKNWEANLRECAYRPFDVRYCYFSNIAMDYPRPEIMRHMVDRDNLALIVARQLEIEREYDQFFVTDTLSQLHTLSIKEANYHIPLYLYPDKDELGLEAEIWARSERGRVPNLSKGFVAALESALGWSFVTEGGGDLQNNFGPEDVLHYAYAIFHSPQYRERYGEFLRLDFPRLPLTSDTNLFAALVQKGSALVDLHLLRGAAASLPSYPAEGDNTVAVGHPRYEAETGRVYINKGQYFEGVEGEAWAFQVGGYQVLEKWLKDRRGRTLIWDDIQTYRQIVGAIMETQKLMAEIDSLIGTFPLP